MKLNVKSFLFYNKLKFNCNFYFLNRLPLNLLIYTTLMIHIKILLSFNNHYFIHKRNALQTSSVFLLFCVPQENSLSLSLIDNLLSYGFRGEALAAICKIAKVSITTKTSQDTLAMIYNIDASGLPTSSKPTHLNNGTVITVTGLFSNLPVRRLFLSSKKKLSEEIKKTEQVVQTLSVIHPELSVSLIHNKSLIWKKNSVKDIKQSFMQVAGLKVVSKMDHISKILNQISLDLIIPKKNINNTETLFNNSPNFIYTFVNKRPVNCKNLSQPVQEHIYHHFSNLNISQKYSTCFISVLLPSQQVDINLEPNKTKVLLKNQLDVIKLIDESLANYYEQQDFTCSYLKNLIIEEIVYDEEPEQPAKRLKVDKSVGEKRSEMFVEKNKGWNLEIINDDCEVKTGKLNSEPLTLCSQINNSNSILTTEEISKFNTIRNECNFNFITSSSNKISEVRLVDGDDIQSRKVEIKDKPEKSQEGISLDVNKDKPILQEWPSRPKVIVEPLPVSPVKDDEMKSVEEIAAEIEKDALNWSNTMIQAIKNETNETEAEKNGYEEETSNFDLSMQSVSSQMGKRELKAFTKFARIMRPKIIEEFPNLMFTQVAGILAERWKNLKPDEVKYYEKMAETIDTNRKIHQEQKEAESKAPFKTIKSSKKTSNNKSLIELMKKKCKINRPPRKEFQIEVSLSLVKKLRKESQSPFLKEEYSIVGQLQPSGNWIYLKGKEIGHIRHEGLQELILSQKMLSGHSVPKKPLDKPIVINQDNLGSDLWSVLMSLETKLDPLTLKNRITDDVITKNGFSIEIDFTEMASCANIIEVPDCIPHFGICELKDALTLYQKNGECGGLVSFRPTAVSNYISNEVIRSAQQESKPPDLSRITEMINTYHLCLTHLPPICLHSKQIFVPFYDIEKKNLIKTGC